MSDTFLPRATSLLLATAVLTISAISNFSSIGLKFGLKSAYANELGLIGDTTSATLTLHIVDGSNDSDLIGAEVTLTASDAVIRTKTDLWGHCSIRMIPPGTYKLEISCEQMSTRYFAITLPIGSTENKISLMPAAQEKLTELPTIDTQEQLHEFPTTNESEPDRQLTPQVIARIGMDASAVVVAAGKNRSNTKLGSGFFVRPTLIATNAHVVSLSSSIVVRLLDGTNRTVPARVFRIDPVHDLALLQVGSSNNQFLNLSSKALPAIGDPVYAIGNPEGLAGTFSSGIVSGIRQLGGVTVLQTTAPISHGSSGGPVLDGSGAVVGIAVAMMGNGQNLNFAVAVRHLIDLLDR